MAGLRRLKLRGEHVMIHKEKGKPVGREHINDRGAFGAVRNWLYPGVRDQYVRLCLARASTATAIGTKI